MKSVCEVVINSPQAGLAERLADPTSLKEWMDDLASYEPLSGEPGMPGAKSVLTFRNGKRTMVFTSTVTERKLPDQVSSRLESPMMVIDVTGRFIPMPDGNTRYISDQTFHFKGLLSTVIGFLAQQSIKKQQRKHQEAFKRLVEQS